MTRTVLHVGLPRTGTTWLQTEVFPKHPGIEFHQTYDWPKLVGLSQHPPKDKARVISCEYWTDWRGGFMRINREIAMLCDMFGPETRILLVTREPDDLLESVYRYSVQHGGANNRMMFMDWFEAKHPGWEIWENHLAAWEKHFSDVHVMEFAGLCQSPMIFLGRLAQTLGISPFDKRLINGHGISLAPTNRSLHRPWLTVMQAVNCVSGTHDLEQGRRPMGRLRRAIMAANERA